MQPGFLSYISYRFQTWLGEGGSSSKAILIFVVCIVFVFVGTGVYCASVGTGPSSAMFTVYKMIMDPAAGYKEPTQAGKIIGVLMALGFLFILAVLVAVVQDSLNGYLEHVRLGLGPVIEVGHILLAGYTDDTFTLIEELCLAHEPEGGTTIVLLAEESKEDLDETFRRAQLDLRNSNLIIRSGNAHSIDNLRDVSAESCDTVVLAPKRTIPREVRDAFTMQALLALAGQDWPAKGCILAVCSLPENQPLFETIGGPKCSVINLDDFMGKLMVKCCDTRGICKIVASLFSFDEGNAFYTKPVPKHLVGLRFDQALFYFPRSVLAGIVNVGTSSRSLCPDMQTTLKAGDDLVLFSEDINHTESTTKPFVVDNPGGACSSRTHMKAIQEEAKKVENILILGFDHQTAGVLLVELEDMVSKGSHVVIVGPQPSAEREAYLEKYQKRMKKKLVNLTIQHVVGRLGSRHVLTDLPVPVTKATRIFVLSDSEAPTPSSADASTVSTLMMVMDLLQSSTENHVTIPILPEFRDRLTFDICEDLKVHDMVDASGTPAQILATIVHAPKLAPVLCDLISGHGHVQLRVCRLSSYLPAGGRVPSSLCFWEAIHHVMSQGDILLGWSRPHQKAPTKAFDQRMAKLCGYPVQHQWDLNPQGKMRQRDWDDKLDMLVVITANVGVAINR